LTLALAGAFSGTAATASMMDDGIFWNCTKEIRDDENGKMKIRIIDGDQSIKGIFVIFKYSSGKDESMTDVPSRRCALRKEEGASRGLFIIRVPSHVHAPNTSTIS